MRSDTGGPPPRITAEGQSARIAASSVLLALHQSGGVLVPLLVGAAIDTALGESPSVLLWWCVTLAAVFALTALAGALGSGMNYAAELSWAHGLRIALVRRILSPHGIAAHGHGDGGLTTLVLRDTRQRAELATVAGTVVPALASMVVGFTALLTVSPALAGLLAAGIGTTLALSRLLSRRLVARIDAERGGLLDIGAHAEDQLTGLRTLKGFHAEAESMERYRRLSRDAVEARVAAIRWESAYRAVNAAASGLLMVGVIWFGGAAVLDGTMTIGSLVGAVGLVQVIATALERLTSMGTLVARASSSRTAIDEVVNAPARVPDGPLTPPAPGPGALRLRGVRSGPLLGLDLDVPAGSRVGIVSRTDGESDALLSLLARESPYEGSVLLDGVELCEMPLAAARERLAVSRHDADLFPGSVLENIASGPDAAHRAARSIRAAAVDEVARALPDGLGTEITERGRSLSGGQRQRVVLARALATDAPVLVLADPLSATDAATEHRVSLGIHRARAGRTTLLLTSSPAVLAGCDLVVVLNSGRVGISGTHAELSRHPAYASAVFA
ncbi:MULTISPECIES: ABC transporter ATP-binding protein [Streptomyces]|uniref:ABC transporter ATP-binding protein n=1 Tax=Streptomyces TaxID=1883 RepID=UPI0029A3AE6B|nr:ABC transporter ATP-binding protein [Streptomyces sp. ME02-6979.5a]MDX3339116.1 ABC transporter ATP-binding protein [Streptomyces sp. ME02-6979.5a]